MGVFGGGAAINCRVLNLPVPPGALTTPAMTAVAFTAEARGDIDGDPLVDVWNINQQKQLVQLAAEDDISL